MPASPEWLAIAATNLASSDEPGSLLLCEGPLDSSAAGDLRTLAEAHGLKPVVVSARTWGLLPMGVARASIAGWIGEAGASADPAFCQDAVGEGAAARAAWDRLQQSWKNHEAGSGLPLPPDDALWRRDVELMARLLAAVGLHLGTGEPGPFPSGPVG